MAEEIEWVVKEVAEEGDVGGSAETLAAMIAVRPSSERRGLRQIVNKNLVIEEQLTGREFWDDEEYLDQDELRVKRDRSQIAADSG